MSAVATPVNRIYRSSLRTEGARQTRRLVLDAALRLFTDQGYARTTLAEIAAGAGVSVETIYKTFRNKRGLLQALADVTVGGDDEATPMLERTGPLALRDETDQRRQLAMFAAGMAVQMDRVGPFDAILRSAAAVDPEVAALRDDLQLRQRRGAMTMIAGWVAARGPLRDRMSVEHAAAVIWSMTSPEVHHMLRTDWGWSTAEYEKWLRDTLTSGLLP